MTVRDVRSFGCAIVLGLMATTIVAGEIVIGERPSDKVNLRDLVGNSRSLRDLQGKAIVVCLLGTECPLANLYIPRLIEMESRYRPQGVQFVAAYPNETDTLDTIAAHVNDRDVPFLVLKDFGQSLANELGVTRTPTVCVLDGSGRLRYRGRIDDQYLPGARRSKPEHRELDDAIRDVLASQSPEPAESVADGCLIQRAREGESGRQVTFHRDVERIVQHRCQACHRPGQAGPMALVTYEDVSSHGSMVAEVVDQRRMPPWHADGRYGNFRDNRRLSGDEVNTILAWHSQGMPEGDPQDAPEPVAWHDQWPSGEPDMVFEIPESVNVPAEGVLPYRYYFVPTGFKEDRWVTIAQTKPSSPQVVHHVIAYIAAPGRAAFGADSLETKVLSVSGPGEAVFVAPEGTAIRVPKDSELVFEMHYTPNGTAATDRTRVGITFAKEPPRRELLVNMFGPNELAIPAFDPHYKQTSDFVFPKDGEIIAVLPHMHVRGKAFRYEATYPDGRAEIIASVPRYDFNWQRNYVFDKPIRVPRGTRIRETAYWDNSPNNPRNPDPSREVPYGLQTSDEMMLGWLTYVLDEPVQPQLPPAKTSPFYALMFRSMDKNKNGHIEPDEVPAKLLDELRAEGVEVPRGISLVGLEAMMASLSDRGAQPKKSIHKD